MALSRVVVYNMLTLIVYQEFDQNGSRNILKKLIFNQGFWMIWKYKLEEMIDWCEGWFLSSSRFSLVCSLVFDI